MLEHEEIAAPMVCGLEEPDSAEALAHSIPRLGKLGEQLRQTSAQIEESVVAVCSSFHDIALRARVSTTRTAEWLRVGEREGQEQRSFAGLIESCETTMVTMIDAFAASGEIARRAVERMQGVNEATRQIGFALGQLDTISHGNKLLALNARIEAAHSGSHSAGFAAVAVELASQTDKSREVTSQVSDLAEHLRALAESTLLDLQQMQVEDSKRAQQCRRDVDQTLQSLRGTHAGMKEMLTQLSAEGALLANDINSAVRGMQFQDRVSQRIAHVIADLEVVQSRLAAHVGFPDVGPIDEEHVDADHGFSKHVMHEERAVYGVLAEESSAGDIELF